MADIASLKKQRQQLKSAFTRMLNYCNRDNAELEQLRARVDNAEIVFQRYEKIQNEIDAEITSDTEQAAEDEYRSDIENAFFSIKAAHYRLQGIVNMPTSPPPPPQENSDLTAAMQALIQHQTSMGDLIERFGNGMRNENASTPNTSHQQVELRLPRIQLPEFDGNLLEWVRFKELFEALIHNRASIANVEKLEYLQSKLKGEALLLIKHLIPTNNNYVIAWELLNKRYNNIEKVKGAYMKLLFEQPTMKTSSLSEIKNLHNNTSEAFNALKVLDENVNQWSSVLLFNIEKKLDNITATLWYREKATSEVTTFEQFLQFLEKRRYELESLQNSHQHIATAKEQQQRPQTRTYATAIGTCPVCSNQHHIFQCDNFKKMRIDQRRVIVQKHGLCFNCLHNDHKANECKSSSCKKCNKRHNTLLHIANNSELASTSQVLARNEANTPNETVDDTNSNIPKATTITSNVTHRNQVCIILPTALINVLDISGSMQQCRALLDSGSQGTLITEACAQRLRLRKGYNKTIVYGLGANSGNLSRGSVKIQIKAENEDKLITTTALCLTNLTQIIPSSEVNEQHLEYFKKLQMADPCWHKPGSIDIILGADVFMECCYAEKIEHPSCTLTALNTIFGWVLMGKMPVTQNQNAIFSNHVSIDLDQQLQRFWEIEDIPTIMNDLTPEEEEAETLFTKTMQRDSNGRYIVKLPLRNGNIDIGQSKGNAIKRLFSMEKRFRQHTQIEDEYKRFMREYIELGHMQEIDEVLCDVICFLPHHAVMKPTSTTTKLRVVFDASNKTTNGKSLNDNLLVGPKLQKDLFDHLISFRIFAVAFTGDIEKMYRQILVQEKDRALQCILWRNSEFEDVKTYCLNTVTYGTACASYLATRALAQVGIDNAESYPTAAAAIKQNFYVDDFMCSTEQAHQAISLKNEIHTLLLQAGFHIRKWSSNSTKFLDTIPNEDKATTLDAQILDASTVSTLGLLWDTKGDFLKYAVATHSTNQESTKRSILSDIARIYDPMGWISPIVIKMKILMQKLWLRGIDWDDQLPADLATEWTNYCEGIKSISTLKISRWLNYTSEMKIELHGFSDASELAYAAAVYAKIYRDDREIITHLLAAKTRVAPVKQITLPRLELCAAHLLVKLMSRVRDSLKLGDIIMHGWSDSTIVLAWISDHPRRWKSFVANRTTQIINVMPAQQWHHIKSRSNPADLATRGICPEELINNKLWWHGPQELRQENFLSRSYTNIADNCHIEERHQAVSNTIVFKEQGYIQRYSSFINLNRITALILRFTHNCKNKHDKLTGFLTTIEIRNAHDKLIGISQRISFAKEINLLLLQKPLPTALTLSSLAPFIDNSGLLRVGGRLTNAEISYDQKHPIILDRRQHLTKLLIEHYHLQHCHAGKRLLQYMIQLKYWIPAGTRIIKQCIYKCTICMRQRAKPFQQQMGDIPKHRLVPTPVFVNIGIDFAGPVQVLPWKGRGKKLYKCWIAIFVCLVTKAIHIELVTEMSSAAFIAALRRFVARRGKPRHIYTDNGTNFVGANQQLTELYNFLNYDKIQDNINKYLAEQQIQWHFNPPSAPHFGGIWEAGVKSMKYHLKRVLKDAHPTFEEMHTLLYQIEACLNSRPLCKKFDDDTDPLTPAHFILLRPMTTIPDEDVCDIKENRLSRWSYIQRLVQQFWKKWSAEYLHQLQQRPKWRHKHENLAVNDVVIVKDENTAPSHWLLGKILELHHGADGLVRVVTLKTTKGQMRRPIVKLCPLVQDC